MMNSNLPRFNNLSERLFEEENLIKNSIKIKIHRLFYHFIENNHTYVETIQKKFLKIISFNKDYETDKFKSPAFQQSFWKVIRRREFDEKFDKN